MYITVTMRAGNRTYNIQTDDQQPIEKAAKALEESLGLFHGCEPVFYKSSRKKALISAFFNFHQAGIHSGDILTAVE